MTKCTLLKFFFVWNIHNKIVRRVWYNIFWYNKKECMIKTRERFSFLPLLTIGVSLLIVPDPYVYTNWIDRITLSSYSLFNFFRKNITLLCL